MEKVASTGFHLPFLKMQDGRQDRKGKSCGFMSYTKKALVTILVAAMASKHIHSRCAGARVRKCSGYKRHTVDWSSDCIRVKL